MRVTNCNHCPDCTNCGRCHEEVENERCSECGCELSDDSKYGMCDDCYKLYYCAECGDELADYGENKTKNGTLLCDVCYAQYETMTYIDELRQCIFDRDVEIAELKARLDKAVALVCNIGDTVYAIHNAYYGGYMIWETNIDEITIDGVNNCYAGEGIGECSLFCYAKDYNKTWFTDKELAEKRLEEMQNEK